MVRKAGSCARFRWVAVCFGEKFLSISILSIASGPPSSPLSRLASYHRTLWLPTAVKHAISLKRRAVPHFLPNFRNAHTAPHHVFVSFASSHTKTALPKIPSDKGLALPPRLWQQQTKTNQKQSNKDCQQFQRCRRLINSLSARTSAATRKSSVQSYPQPAIGRSPARPAQLFYPATRPVFRDPGNQVADFLFLVTIHLSFFASFLARSAL